ncbi:MAG: tryptophan synthase subunit alpha [Verrucomicrobiota bacterium]
MNRIDKLFSQYRKDGRKALVLYVTAGDPELPFTEQLISEIINAGGDIIEIGIPFSDPMADGPTIQAASERALKNDISLTDILGMVARLREKHPETPFVLFGYYNLLLHYGIEELARDSAAAGVDGWLIVDMPDVEDGEVVPALAENGLHKITLLAPTSGRDRMRKLLEKSRGFVYYITVTGVTGARDELPEDLADHLRTVTELASIPVVAGFGVSTPEMARQVAQYTDGVVVGSKLVQTAADAPDRETALKNCRNFIRELSKPLHSITDNIEMSTGGCFGT